MLTPSMVDILSAIRSPNLSKHPSGKALYSVQVKLFVVPGGIAQHDNGISLSVAVSFFQSFAEKIPQQVH